MLSEGQAIWVGCLDLDGADLDGVPGYPLSKAYSQARIMVRLHKAPLGHLYLPLEPAETLTSRARAAASTTLAPSWQRHIAADRRTAGLAGSPDWSANMTCPQNFPDSGGPGLTVVICTRNRAASLRECLRALQQVVFAPMEILVVDNAPDDEQTRQAVMAAAGEDSRIRYTRAPRAGLSRARNHGLAHARFEIVAFTDDDTVADPGWPSALAAAFAADPQTTCVTGLVATSSLDTGCERYFDSRYSWGRKFEACRYDLTEHRHPSPLYPFCAGIFGTGANFAVRRSAALQIGGFDPLLGAGGLGLGGEDLDMFLRIILAGGRISYLPAALVWHKHRVETQALAEQIFSYGHGLGAYVAKHLSSRQMRPRILATGLLRTYALSVRMRQAAHDSQLRANGKRLAFDEVRGVTIGALRYYRAARPASRCLPGQP